MSIHLTDDDNTRWFYFGWQTQRQLRSWAENAASLYQAVIYCTNWVDAMGDRKKRDSIEWAGLSPPICRLQSCSRNLGQSLPHRKVVQPLRCERICTGTSLPEEPRVVCCVCICNEKGSIRVVCETMTASKICYRCPWKVVKMCMCMCIVCMSYIQVLDRETWCQNEDHWTTPNQ